MEKESGPEEWRDKRKKGGTKGKAGRKEGRKGGRKENEKKGRKEQQTEGRVAAMTVASYPLHQLRSLEQKTYNPDTRTTL